MCDRRTVAAALILGVAGAALAPVPTGVVITESAITTVNGKTTASQIVYSVKALSLRVHKNRSDGQGVVGLIHIYDAAAGRLVILNGDEKQAEIYDAAKASAEVEKRLPTSRIVADLKATGRTQELLGLPCEEYSFVLKAPLTQNVMLVRSGTAWIAKHPPGLDEYVAFFRAAETVLVAGSVNVPKTVLAVDRTETELYRRIAVLGGMPYALDMKLEVEGSGLTASLLRKMLTTSRTVTTTAVDTTPVLEQVFAIPVGWKIKTK